MSSKIAKKLQEDTQRAIAAFMANAPDVDAAQLSAQYDEFFYVSSLRATSAEDQLRQRANAHREFYPLTAPGMPIPGPDIVRLAKAQGSEIEWAGKGAKLHLQQYDEILENFYRDMLYSAGKVHVPISVDHHHTKRLAVVTGHRWFGDVTGPLPTDVMVVSKMLGEDEKNAGRNLIGPSGELLQDMCEKLRLVGYEDWYVTNVVKTEHPLAATGNTTLKVPLVREFLPLLHQELRIVRPKYILLMGADATKAVLGKRATVSGMLGRVVEYTYPVGRTADDHEMHTALVMCCLHPAYVLRMPELETQLENELSRWGQLIQGFRPDKPELDIKHRAIETTAELKELYLEIQQNCVRNTISIDAEWHGQHPENKGSYVRSIQISWAPKHSCYIHLRHPGGKWRFKGSRRQLCKWIKRICQGKRLVGQFLLADMEWFLSMGLDLREEFFNIPNNWEEYMENQLSDHPTGGFDTGLALHAIDETADFGLTAQTLRFTPAPRYDVELTAWRDAYCAKHKLKRGELDGYGMCPDSVIVPYGNYDADVPSRLVPLYEKMLTSDRFGNNCWEAFWMSMRATPAVLEMNTTGLLIDKKRVDDLSQQYLTCRERLKRELREWAKWPDLNLNSTFEIRELLFGEDLNGKKRDDPLVPVRQRPKGARSMKINPCMTADKRPMPWDEAVRKGEAHLKTPSTNKTSLAILAQDNTAVRRMSKTGKEIKVDYSPILMKLRNYRFISQVLKGVLRDPNKDEAGQFIMEDEFHTYTGGLPGRICDDGRVRTHISQTKETRRWSSWNPPLQNLAKRREADYAAILGNLYTWPIRSIVTASPGHLLVEADFAGAELLGMALLSGDPHMIDHAMRASLPESHPDYYDIHSNVTVMAFHLSCPPTKSGLKSIGKAHLRVVAKSVAFGLAYGRGAKAIALALREEGVSVSVEEAQQIIDAFLQMYPGLVPFFDACRERAIKERWICGAFGGFRRFSAARDRKVVGDQERQAMNFPIQNLVGDAATRACDHLYHYRETHPLVDYRILLQIHDALLLEVPYGHVEVVMKEVLPTCMSTLVPIYPTDLAGYSLGTGPFHLGVDVECSVSWGVSMKPHDYLSRNLNPELGHWEPQTRGWTHPSKPGKIWVGDASGGQMLAV